MNKSNSKVILSITGAIVVFIIIVLVNIIGSKVNFRLDLTENSIYTLSEGSKKILAKLDTPVTIKFYFSKGNNRMPVTFKNYARRVEDLLGEYKTAGKGNIILEKYDPEPDSDAEDSAMMDGIKGQMIGLGEDKIYFGVSISCVDKTVAIPFLTPNRENMLEYDLTRAITEVFVVDKPVIGVISALPVMGGMNPQAMMMQQRGMMPQSTPPWVFVQELRKNYEVKEVPFTTEKIGDDIDLLMIVHPSGISEKTEFAIDQFIMKGGKVVAFLDPMSYFASNQKDRQMMMKMSSTLPNLLKAWKIDFKSDQVIADTVYGRRIPQRNVNMPPVLDMPAKAFSKDNVLTSQLDNLTMIFAGAFSGTPAEGLTKQELFTTSDKAGFINAFMARSPQMSLNDIKIDDTKHALAISLSGKFKSAFPEGLKDSTEKSDKNKKQKTSYLKKSEKESTVILIGDSDMLVNEICVSVQNIFGQQVMAQINDNLNLSQNVVDFLAGDQDMINVRCRHVNRRPFTKVKEMRSEAEQKYKTRISEMEQALKSTQMRLNELQRKKKGDDQQFILSPEQQKEIAKFKEKQVSLRKDLKDLRKQLRKDIDSLENNIKWLNIALMPMIIALLGLAIAFHRKKKGSAK